jgi:2-keto-4-pentenoate hydratase/2-oxohepta-3-ene-1,7-dioic acid hydratase in catechol pathway
MKLVTFQSNGEWRSGIDCGEKVVESTSAARAASIRVGRDPVSSRTILKWTTTEQMRLDAVARELAASDKKQEGVHALEELRLGPPVPDPEKIICLGLNYRSHADEAGLELPKVPMLFAKYRNALTGPTSPIVLPAISREIDYEGELAVVIGRRCRDIRADHALDYVAGYMVLNDVSARDIQLRTSQWLSGKSMDTFAPCGPALLLNEIIDPQTLDISTRVNGQTLQQGNTRNMIFPVRDVLAYVSQLMTLEPGDVISTGTPEGVGFKRTPPIFLKEGDVVEVEVEGIGVLRNPVVASAREADRTGGRRPRP